VNAMIERPVVSAEIDQLDLKILASLQKNGRLKKVELSDQVGLSSTPCCLRLEKLEKAKFIRGYHAEIDLDKLANLSQYMVLVSISDYTPDRARLLEVEIARSPFISECMAVFGAVDYLLKVSATSPAHFHEIMAPLLGMALDYTTYPVSRVVQRPHDRSLLDLVSVPRAR
jgi:Lrp/AsnC family transcriptional regulator of ectoine degradation